MAAIIPEIVAPEATKQIIDTTKAMNDLDKSLDAFLASQKELNTSFDKTKQSTDDAQKKSSEYAKILNKTANGQKKLTEHQKLMMSQQKQLASTSAKLNNVRSQTNKILVENKLKLSELNKQTKQNIQSQQLINERLKSGQKDAAQITGRYKALSETLNRQRALAKDLAVVYGQNSKQYKAVAKDVNKLDKELVSIDKNLGQNQRRVGAYGDAMGGLSPKFGGMINSIKAVGGALKTLFLNPVGLVIAAVVGLGAVIGKAVKQAKEYQAANAELAGVMGITRDQTRALQAESQRLGASTAFTALEVTQLQTEYARLGFAQKEIMAVTESTINLSIAAKSGTAETAAFVGATIRGMGLAAEDAARVADVAAKSFSSSALDFNKLNTALSAAAPAAKASGKSLEFTVARLGKLADAGLDASTAGVSLRNIFLDLSKKGLTYDQAMDKINKSTNKNKTAMDLFGKRGAVSALVLAEQAEAAAGLENALNSAGGAAERTAKEQLNTLDGSIKLLGSAWSGLLFSFEDGEGVFIKIAKHAVDYLTALLNGIKIFVDGIGFAFGLVTNIFKDLFELVSPTIDKVKEFGQTITAWIGDKIQPIIDKIVLLKNTVSGLFSSKDNENASKFSKTMGKVGDLFRKGKQYVKDFADERKKAQLDQKAASEEEKTATQTTTQAVIDAEALKAQAEKDSLKERQKEFAAFMKERENARKINAKHQAEINKTLEDMEAEHWEEINAQEEAEHAADIAMMEAEADAAIREKERAYERELMLIDASSKNAEEAAQRKIELDKSIVQEQIDNMMLLLEASDISAAQRIELEQALADKQLELNQIVAEDDKKKTEEKKARIQAIADTTTEIGNALFDFAKARTSREMELLERQKEDGQITEEEYAEKKKQLELKAARQERASALFNIAINTAVGISKLIGNPLAPFLIPAAIALGAIQAATVLSQPLPELATGSEDAPSSFIAGEKGRELVLGKSGDLYMADTPTKFEGFKGAKVYTNKETEWIMNQTSKPEYIERSTTDPRMLKKLDEVASAIKNKPVILFDKDRNPIGYQKNQTTVRMINKYKYN